MSSNALFALVYMCGFFASAFALFQAMKRAHFIGVFLAGFMLFPLLNIVAGVIGVIWWFCVRKDGYGPYD